MEDQTCSPEQAAVQDPSAEGSPSPNPAPVPVVPPLGCSITAPSYVSSLTNSYELVPALCSTQASCMAATFHPLHASKSLRLSFPKYV